MSADKVISIRLSSELIDRIQKTADKQAISRHRLIANFITTGLETLENLTKKEKTDALSISFPPEEKRLIERLAFRGCKTITQYVRACVLMDFLTSGDAESRNYALSRFGDGVRKTVKDLIHDL